MVLSCAKKLRRTFPERTMSYRFLIIDDEERIFSLINRFLLKEWPEADIEHYNPVVRGRPDGKFDCSVYALIVLDYNLGLNGDDNGLMWLRALRKRPDVGAIMFLTGMGTEETAIGAFKGGADDYLPKNQISYSRFIASAKEILASREQAKAAQRLALREQKDAYNTVTEKTQAIAQQGLKEIWSDSMNRTVPDNATPAARPDRTPGAPLTIPGYVIGSEIGAGGMSTVYLATQKTDGAQVVLKVVDTKLCDDSVVFKRFAREHTLISKLRHPHVVSTYERGFAKDYAYIAMEYFPQGDLIDKVKKGMSAVDATRYLTQITMGLGAVHELGIIHRDLKPGNIMFRDDDTVAITDFGIAKITDSNANLTMHDIILGTPAYMSPEQVAQENVDQRADLYSLGVMFFEMLTRVKPYRANSLARLVYEHVHAPIPTLEGKLAQFQPIIDGLLAKDPDERFQNSHELLIALGYCVGSPQTAA